MNDYHHMVFNVHFNGFQYHHRVLNFLQVRWRSPHSQGMSSDYIITQQCMFNCLHSSSSSSIANFLHVKRLLSQGAQLSCHVTVSPQSIQLSSRVIIIFLDEVYENHHNVFKFLHVKWQSHRVFNSSCLMTITWKYTTSFMSNYHQGAFNFPNIVTSDSGYVNEFNFLHNEQLWQCFP